MISRYHRELQKNPAPLLAQSEVGAVSDLLRSFGCGMGHLIGFVAAMMMPFSRRSPHSISAPETGKPAAVSAITPLLRSQGVVLAAIKRTSMPRSFARISASTMPEPV